MQLFFDVIGAFLRNPDLVLQLIILMAGGLLSFLLFQAIFIQPRKRNRLP